MTSQEEERQANIFKALIIVMGKRTWLFNAKIDDPDCFILILSNFEGID